MVPDSASLTFKAPLLHRFVGFSRRPTTLSGHLNRVPINPVQMRGSRSCASCQSYSYPSRFGHGSLFKSVGLSEMGFRQLGFGHFWVSAVPDGVSVGTGGNGGSGDGNSRGRGEGGGGGDGSDGDGGNNLPLISWYLALLAKYPVSTKALTSALLTLIGDLICQVVIDQVPSLDWKRTFLFTLLGLVLVGPTLHFWYLYLSRLVTLPGASGVFLRLLLDQFLFSPIFIGVFLATLVTLEGRPSQVIPKLQQEWLAAVLANWKLWIPFQFLNFRFVPQQFQVLAANFVALVWNVVLSFIAHKEIHSK
ncbi:protein sym-1-like [Juglans microcarpa x Juglans regia]|uniref:protein sym-1-like n=1 Tax=Juglans microcarpa x Juglans regia TaxID=2249226 RepID=UPI001B7F240F|nr:protein sym-1-like [Juglans microcarpa x Juglans regia]